MHVLFSLKRCFSCLGLAHWWNIASQKQAWLGGRPMEAHMMMILSLLFVGDLWGDFVLSMLLVFPITPYLVSADKSVGVVMERSFLWWLSDDHKWVYEQMSVMEVIMFPNIVDRTITPFFFNRLIKWWTLVSHWVQKENFMHSHARWWVFFLLVYVQVDIFTNWMKTCSHSFLCWLISNFWSSSLGLRWDDCPFQMVT